MFTMYGIRTVLQYLRVSDAWPLFAINIFTDKDRAHFDKAMPYVKYFSREKVPRIAHTRTQTRSGHCGSRKRMRARAHTRMTLLYVRVYVYMSQLL